MRALVVLGLLTLVGCDWEEVVWSARSRFDRTVAFEPTGTFRLDNVNGKVRIEPWDRPEVRIEAEKSASNEEYLESIKIEVLAERDRVEVRTRYPRKGLFLGGHGMVEYHIYLPARARVEVKTVNGSVEVDGLAGTVRASTVNGSVRVTETSGAVDASTVNGSIRAEYRKVAGEEQHHFSTTNGSVTVYLPSDAGGDVEASTVNGSIRTDFPLTVSGKFGNRRMQGRLGDGRTSFRIRTVNGSVKLLRGSGEKVV